MRHSMVHLVSILILAVLSPACGSGGGGGGGIPAPIVLLSDDFSGAFPGSNWVLQSGTNTINAGAGNPAPCVSTTGGFRTAATFSTASGLTISFDVGPTSQTANLAFIVDAANPSAMDTYSANSNGGTVGYAILSQTATQPVVTDSNFHRFRFKVSGGMASWYRDGSLQLTKAYTAANIWFQLQQNGGFTPFYDNVTVTVP